MTEASTQPASNAAIWFAGDGYDPSKGINGRRVAGESFLRGFFNHAAVAEFVSLTHFSADHVTFADMARAAKVTRPLREVLLHQPQRMAPVDVVYYPAPLDPVECWRRAPHGGAAWALCGITHTTATLAVMRSIFDLRSAPQMPWDALICTSQAVQQSMRTLMELAETHLASRFPGAILPTRPLLPVIPLGVHADDFRPDPGAGQALRQRLGIAEGDVVALTIARLTPDEKFDPYPLFLAMEAAAPDLAATGARFHLVLCGQFSDPSWTPAFAEAAARLMPGCGYHLLDGGDPVQRKAALSGADVFVFPIDNVQETYGLAPVEAMAAGLPLIVSDWDGMKDTVTPEVGIRVPTEMPGPGEATHLSQRFLGGTDRYLQFLGQLSAMTRVSVPALTRALVTLGTDPALRRRMGAAGQARVRSLYDWRRVIPQMQALWAEQSTMLAHARTRGGRGMACADAARLPVAPAPDVMFAGYPSARLSARETRLLRAIPLAGRPDVAQTFDLRRYQASLRLIETPARIQTILDAFAASGAAGATEGAVAAATGLHPHVVGRSTLWLLKYNFLTEVT
ncbi:MAG: glycosyltransferase family 4 protein [Rhodobacterales bacterium]|nr:glycosyltransferase family 4 protein [Rhodobacterales bacterium]